VSKHLIVLLLLGVSVSVGCGGSAGDPVYADTHPLSVPVIVTPSIQIATGQMILYKASNVSMGPASFRLMVYNEKDGIPAFYKDFPKVPAGNTVTYAYRPPMRTLALDEQTSVEVPEAVRATFAPIPQVDHNVIRQIVANVEIIRVQQGANGVSTIDTPVVVPLSHCNFEPRGRVPYIGGAWYWNCAPGVYPLKRNEGNEG
jgi:hypothetical protein